MMERIIYIFKILMKRIFLGSFQNNSDRVDYITFEKRMVNYHMSSVFPDKKTKDAIMNNISSGILNDINIEKTGA